MKTFFLILFFGNFTFLTSSGIDIGNEWSFIEFEKPIKAINNGASIIIQLPPDGEIVKSIDPKGDVFEQLNNLLPPETISARLQQKDSSVLLISHSFSISDFTLKSAESVRIHLKGNISPKVKYDSVKIKSNVPLNNVRIGFKNYSM